MDIKITGQIKKAAKRNLNQNTSIKLEAYYAVGLEIIRQHMEASGLTQSYTNRSRLIKKGLDALMIDFGVTAKDITDTIQQIKEAPNGKPSNDDSDSNGR